MAELGALEAMAELGALEAMAGCLRGLGLGPLGLAPTAGTLSTPPPPPPNFPGVFRGYQEPSGAKQTGQDRDRTTHRNRKPSWAKLGSGGFLWAWRGVRGPYRVAQQPLPSQRQGGRRLEWPPWPQQEEPPAPDESPRTRQGYLKCSCGHNKTDTRHSWPWHVDLIHGARDSGGRRAWVSANPAGLSQRRSGGLESAAIRRAWVSGDPAGIESEAIRRALSQRRAGGVIPRSAGMRARDQRTRGTRGDPAELPHRPAVGYGGMTSGDFLAAGQTHTNRLEQK